MYESSRKHQWRLVQCEQGIILFFAISYECGRRYVLVYLHNFIYNVSLHEEVQKERAHRG
jgi:hypothetical protein